MSSQKESELENLLTRLSFGSTLTANHLLPTAQASLAPRPARVGHPFHALPFTLFEWHLRLPSAEHMHTLVNDHCNLQDMGMHVPLAFMWDSNCWSSLRG